MTFRIKTILAGCIVLLLAVGVILFAYSIRSMAVDTDIVAQDVANIEARAQEAQNISSMLAQSGDAAERVKDLFVRSTEVVQFIETIEAEARKQGVLITVDSVEDPRVKKSEAPVAEGETAEVVAASPEALPFESSFTLSGSRTAIEAFLDALSFVQYHLQINEISLSVREGSAGWIGNLRLQAYMIEVQ